jgi:hypothetical protein
MYLFETSAVSMISIDIHLLPLATYIFLKEAAFCRNMIKEFLLHEPY